MFLDFLIKRFFFFTISLDPEVVKKRRIKQLAREIAKNKYAYFYQPKFNRISATLGKFFYELYKIAAPAQTFLRTAAKSAMLKQTAVEFFLDEELDGVKERLTESAIVEQGKTADIPHLVRSTEEDLSALAAAFDAGRHKNIDHCYNNILYMTRFVSFDFFTLLKKFDSGISERNFNRWPVFSPVPGEILSDELKDFLEISFSIDFDRDWENTLRILKAYRHGEDVISHNSWNKVLTRLQDVRRSGILELMVRHIDKNPEWRLKPGIFNAHITEQYLEAKKTEINTAVEKIIASRKNARRAALVDSIFGSAEIKRARYYTEEAGEIYRNRSFAGFPCAAAINYFMAFLMDICGSVLRDLSELLFIRGKWIIPEFAGEISEHFYRLMESGNRLNAFDDSFSDLGVNGSRLKAALFKVDQDPAQRRFIAQILTRTNEDALELIDTGLRSMAVIGKNLKALLEDRQNTTHKLIMNWQELEAFFPESLTQRLAAVCKKIDAFIDLMLFISAVSNEPSPLDSTY